MVQPIAEETMIRDAIRQVARKYDRAYWLAKARDGTFTKELWQELAEGGFLGMMIPPEYGGGGLGLQQMSVLLEEMSYRGYPCCCWWWGMSWTQASSPATATRR